jgi:hypothetical protein
LKAVCPGSDRRTRDPRSIDDRMACLVKGPSWASFSHSRFPHSDAKRHLPPELGLKSWPRPSRPCGLWPRGQFGVSNSTFALLFPPSPASPVALPESRVALSREPSVAVVFPEDTLTPTMPLHRSFSTTAATAPPRRPAPTLPAAGPPGTPPGRSSAWGGAGAGSSAGSGSWG